MARREKETQSALRNERRKRGLSITGLARRIEYHPSYVSGVELGRLTPSEDFLKRYAQGLGLPDDTFMSYRRQTGTANQVGSPLQRVDAGVQPPQLLTPQASLPTALQRDRPLQGDREIRGRRRTLEAVTALIDSAASQDAAGREILITSLGRPVPFEGQPDMLGRWRQSVQAAMDRGWTIQHLWRLDGDRGRTLKLVGDILHLVEPGERYQPSYFTDYGTLEVPYALVLVTGIGALLLMATSESGRASSALFFPGSASGLLRDHFYELKRHTRPLLRVYPRQGSAWDLASVDTPDTTGDRLSVNPVLGAYTRPAFHYQPGTSWYRRYEADTESRDMQAVVESRVRLVQAFEDQVRTYRYYQIASKRGIRAWALSGVPTDLPHRFRSPDPPKERLERLENATELLRHHGDTNLRIALLDDSEESLLVWSRRDGGKMPALTWSVRGAEKVLLTASYPAQRGAGEMGIVIDEPTVAEAFRQYFDHLWGRISPRNYDKDYVISWLRNLIDELR